MTNLFIANFTLDKLFIANFTILEQLI